MINISKAKNEKNSDKKRDRLLLTIGDNSYHITKAEALNLRNQLNRYNLSNKKSYIVGRSFAHWIVFNTKSLDIIKYFSSRAKAREFAQKKNIR